MIVGRHYTHLNAGVHCGCAIEEISRWSRFMCPEIDVRVFNKEIVMVACEWID